MALPLLVDLVPVFLTRNGSGRRAQDEDHRQVKHKRMSVVCWAKTDRSVTGAGYERQQGFEGNPRGCGLPSISLLLPTTRTDAG